MAAVTKLKSGSWRVQVRRKGKYVSETFLRRRDAEEWALDIECRIDRGESPTKEFRRAAKTFGELIRLHMEDFSEVGKPLGRSKAASLRFLERRLGKRKIPELDRERLIEFARAPAREGAGPVTLSIDLGYINTILSQAAAAHRVRLSTEPIDLARFAAGRLVLGRILPLQTVTDHIDNAADDAAVIDPRRAMRQRKMRRNPPQLALAEQKQITRCSLHLWRLWS